MNTIEAVKGAIKDNVAESLEIRKRIHASKGREKSNFWQNKRGLGEDTRYILLAYACLRARPYVQLEQKVHPGNEPSPSEIVEKICHFLPKEGPERALWTKERAKVWLEAVGASEAKGAGKEAA
jgi:hypothetical protein